MGNVVRVAGGETRVDLERGGYVMVRPLGRSAKSEINAGVGVDGTFGRMELAASLQMRATIVRAEGVVGPDGASMADRCAARVTDSRVRGVTFAHPDVFDALTDQDIDAIGAAMRDDLTEDQRGK